MNNKVCGALTNQHGNVLRQNILHTAIGNYLKTATKALTYYVKSTALNNSRSPFLFLRLASEPIFRELAFCTRFSSCRFYLSLGRSLSPCFASTQIWSQLDSGRFVVLSVADFWRSQVSLTLTLSSCKKRNCERRNWEKLFEKILQWSQLAG